MLIQKSLFFFGLTAINLAVLAYGIYGGLRLGDYVNVFILETFCILGFFVLEFSIYKIYRIFRAKESVWKNLLSIIGNILICSLVYSFILWTLYFLANEELIHSSKSWAMFFFGELFEYKTIAIALLLLYFVEFIEFFFFIDGIEGNAWFFLRPHIRILVFWFIVMLAAASLNLYILLLIKVILDGAYVLFTNPKIGRFGQRELIN